MVVVFGYKAIVVIAHDNFKEVSSSLVVVLNGSAAAQIVSSVAIEFKDQVYIRVVFVFACVQDDSLETCGVLAGTDAGENHLVNGVAETIVTYNGVADRRPRRVAPIIHTSVVVVSHPEARCVGNIVSVFQVVDDIDAGGGSVSCGTCGVDACGGIGLDGCGGCYYGSAAVDGGCEDFL